MIIAIIMIIIMSLSSVLLLVLSLSPCWLLTLISILLVVIGYGNRLSSNNDNTDNNNNNSNNSNSDCNSKYNNSGVLAADIAMCCYR